MKSRYKDISVVGFLIAACISFANLFHKTSGLLSYDEGMLLNAASWVNKGLVPFKDYIYLINMPGHSYVISLFFRILGESALAGRISVITMFTLMCVLVYLMLKQIVSRPFACAGALFFIVTVRFRDWYFPYPSWYAMPFALMAVYFTFLFLDRLGRRQRGGMFLWAFPLLAGVSSTVAFFSKQNIGILNAMVILAFMVILFILPRLRQTENLQFYMHSIDAWKFMLFYFISCFVSVMTLFIYYLVKGAFFNLLFYCFKYPFIYAGGQAWSTPQLLLKQMMEYVQILPGSISFYGYVVLTACVIFVGGGIYSKKYRGILFLAAIYLAFSYRNLLVAQHPFAVLIRDVISGLLAYSFTVLLLLKRFIKKKFGVKETKILLLLFMAVSFVGHIHPHWIEITHHALAKFPAIMLWMVLFYELFIYSKEKLEVKPKDRIVNNTPYMILVVLLIFTIINPLAAELKEPMKAYRKNNKFPTVILDHPKGKVYVWDYVAANISEVITYLDATLKKDEEFLVFPVSNMFYFFLDKKPPTKIFEFLPRNGPLSEEEFIRIMKEVIDKRIRYCVFDNDAYIGWQMPQIYPLYNFFNRNYALKRTFKNFRIYELKEDAFGPILDLYAAEEIFSQAKKMYYGNDFKKADELINAAIDLNPQEAKFYYFRGANIKDWVLDTAAKKVVDRLGASGAGAYLTNRRFSPVLLGDIFYQLGMYDEAVMEYMTELTSKPDEVATRFKLAQAFEELGKITEAIEEYNRCLASDGSFADAQAAVKRLTEPPEQKPVQLPVSVESAEDVQPAQAVGTEPAQEQSIVESTEPENAVDEVTGIVEEDVSLKENVQ